jgi:hypothetical protein
MTLSRADGMVLCKPPELRRHTEIGIAEANHVERIEGIHAEAEKAFLDDEEVFEAGEVHDMSIKGGGVWSLKQVAGVPS